MTNVVAHATSTPDEFEVQSCFIVYRGRLEREVEIYSGTRLDRIRRAPSVAGWHIAARRITLDQSTILGRDLNIIF